MRKELWQMTREEWLKEVRKEARNYKFPGEFIINAGFSHRRFVAQALYEGKPVPLKVLKDYPDLLKEYKRMEGSKRGRGGEEEDKRDNGESEKREETDKTREGIYE